MQELTSLVGKAFQRAFAVAKVSAGTDHNTRIVDPVRDSNQPAKGRRWVSVCMVCRKFLFQTPAGEKIMSDFKVHLQRRLTKPRVNMRAREPKL